MDISTAFKESVHSILIHHKNVRNAKENIINRKIKKSFFGTKGDLIVNQINEFNKIIRESREAYMNFPNFFINESNMPSKTRDEIDVFAQTITSECFQVIKELKEHILHLGISRQSQEHNKTVVSLLEEYLRDIYQIYLQQKAMRIRKINEMKRADKLQFQIKHYEKYDVENLRHGSTNHSKINQVDSILIQEVNGDIYQTSNIENEQLNSKDIQLFEIENERLYNELNTLTEEMKEIENKVVNISELQDIFSEKILYQEKSLEHVLTTVVNSTENVKEANEQIRNAIQRNAGFRVWILFFLLVLSFSLIFLDWYKP